MTSTIPRDIRPAFAVEVPREQVGTKLRELIGLDEVPGETDFTIESTEEDEGLRLVRVSYSNSLGETISAIAMEPLDQSTGMLPGVVCMPGTGSCAEQVIDKRFYRERPDKGPLIGWGRELARRGYYVLSFSPKGSAVRRGTIERWEEEAKLLAPYGRPQMGVLVDEVLRATRVLGAMDGVNPTRIGVTGMSLGGLGSWMGMACGPWIRAGASICGVIGSLARLIHDGQVRRHSSFIFVPHMLRYFDHAEIVAACVAPRPFMTVAPSEDEDMPREGVDELVQAVAPLYESMGYPEHFKVHQPPGHHVFLFDYFEWMVQWFDRFLAPSSGR